MAAKRLLVSLDEQTFKEIQELANINNESSSKIARNLIKMSIELEEDKMLSRLADERISTTKKWLSHEDAWK